MTGPPDTRYLRDHAETRGFMLGRPVKPKPTPDGSAVLFLRAKPRLPRLSLFEFDCATGSTKELLTPEQLLKGAEEHLSPAEKARRERQRVSVGGFTDYHLSRDGSRVLLGLSGRLYLLDRATGAARELPTATGTIVDPKFSPDGTKISYVLDHDLRVIDLATSRDAAVTRGGTPGTTHGLAEFVAQEEMGRFTGYWWSPDSRSIAYEEADMAGVAIWYVADPAKPGQPPLTVPYPRPGAANAVVRLGVVPVAGGETVWVTWDAGRYPYLARVGWEKYGPLTLTVQDRRQQELRLLKVDPATGATAELLTEHSETWLNLDQDLPRWFADGKRFLWHSQDKKLHRDSFGVWDSTTRSHHPFSLDRLEFRGLTSFEPDHPGRVVFSATPREDPSSIGLFRLDPEVELMNAGPARVTDVSHGPGVHAAAVAKDASVYVLTSTTFGSMPGSTVHTADGTRVGELPSVAESPPFTPNVELVRTPGTVRTEPGGPDLPLVATVVRPRAFDRTRRYPVILDVYGGPHHQTVVNSERNWLLDQWLADQGFIVVGIDNRGTPGRGRDWERAIFKKFDTVPLDDQIAGLQALGKKFPELDLDRVGVVGWSFGGYMAALAVLKRPDVFKAAVAGAPVTDWLDYDTHYTERYLGLPADDPAVYTRASLLTYADRLSRPLLLVHGTADDNVYFRHTLRLADALFRAGKEFDVLPLSGLTHMVPDPVVAERLWTRVVMHFRKALKGG